MSPGKVRPDNKYIINRRCNVTELKRPTLWQVFTSVTAAMFGVQIERGTFSDYAIVGGVLAVLFVVIVIAVVQLVMYVAGY
jgi:hypothetical protein